LAALALGRVPLLGSAAAAERCQDKGEPCRRDHQCCSQRCKLKKGEVKGVCAKSHKPRCVRDGDPCQRDEDCCLYDGNPDLYGCYGICSDG
jgi:hypothetical protein